MTERPRIGHDWTSGQEMANDKVCQHLQGGQGQVGGPQVPLLGHGNEVESPNWACRYSWTGYGLSGGWSTSRRWPRPGHWTTGASSGPWIQDRVPELGEPWEYVAPVVAAVMTRATGVRLIYLI